LNIRLLQAEVGSHIAA